MNYIFLKFLLGLVVGFLSSALSNPAPYFAALGLVVAPGAGCGVLMGHGGSCLSLVLFLIYLGGMLVVFAYSAALAAKHFPESWGDRSVVGYVLLYMSVVFLLGLWGFGGWYEGSWAMMDNKEFFMVRGDMSGVAFIYSFGGGMLVVCGWVLLLSLFVVLELTRGLNRGALWAV